MTFAQLSVSTEAFADTYDDDIAVDVDRAYGNQCWDLAALFARQIVGCPSLPTGKNKNAVECYTEFSNPLPQYFTRYAINETRPRKGDLMIWDINHIAVYLSPTPSGFISLDQNWPLGSKTKRVHHSMHRVIGLLRPITKEEVIDMVNDTDNEYGRWFKLGLQIRGRALSREEFRVAAVGKTWLKAMEILSDSTEADTVTQFQNVGAVAVRDKWDQQIYGLQEQLRVVQLKADELAARPTKDQFDALQDQIRRTTMATDQAVKTVSPPQTDEPPAPPKPDANWFTKLVAAFVKPKA
jgi:hypothetical protein